MTDSLRFPLTWHGRLITHASTGDITPLIQSIYAQLALSNTEAVPANISAKGTYRTWQLRADVPDADTLHSLFSRLENLPGVKMLI